MGKPFNQNFHISIFTIFFFTLSLLAFADGGPSFADSTRGIKVSVKDLSGQEIPLYEGSYALLIGASDYTAGWPDLRNIPGELDQVEKTLRKHGFQITRIMNPDSKALNSAFEDFIDRYGFDVNNRLLFFFSGHGHTRKGGEKGYLVPVDAPPPQKDERGFLRKTLPMAQIISWSRQMEAKHAMFLFDSCFSGTVFKIKALPGKPSHITRATSLPVRQYITAGDAGDAVPAASVFTPVFIDALTYGWADLNGDGYVSGTELGIYLQEKVPLHTAQTPQYGKIKDYKLSRGDFIFIINTESGSCTLQVASTPPGAKVLVDGRLKGISPLEVTGLKPGRLTVEAQKKGYALWKEQVLIREDRPLEINAVLKEIRSDGTIRITSDLNQARWYLDGVYAGRTPDVMKNVPPGTHRITVKGKGYSDWSEMVHVPAGEQVKIHARLRTKAQETEPQECRLYVDTDPEDALVKIMNIRPKYHSGMSLAPGNYHLNVSAPGFVENDQWITLSKGEERHINIELTKVRTSHIKQAVKHSTPVAKSVPRRISSRDGIYVAFTNGIIKDTKTGLEWVAGPDKNTNWHNARAWIKNLTLEGGGWRMPTKDEIKGLYKPGAGPSNKTSLFKNAAWWVWAGETKGSSQAWIFYFSGGYGYWLDRNTGDNLRAFAVRSGSIGIESPKENYVGTHLPSAGKKAETEASVATPPGPSSKKETESGRFFDGVTNAFQSFKKEVFSSSSDTPETPKAKPDEKRNLNEKKNFNEVGTSNADPTKDAGI
jgi:hypothetical protein